MITDLLKPYSGEQSTAQRVASYFSEKGMSRDAISGKHLEPLYTALSESAHTGSKGESGIPTIKTSHAATDSEVCGVIIETREQPALEYVVCQFSELLNIPIQLFHGTTNQAFIMDSKISDLIDQGKVVLSAIDADSFTPEQYNSLFLSKRFWESMTGRNRVLVFQADAILCSESDFNLADFVAFDYIGSKWPRMRPVGMVMDGGNGGLSLRNWQQSVECIERFPPALWPGGEDGYFAFHLDLVGGNVGRDKDCARFSTQFEFLERSFGGHQISLLEPASLEQFIQYCPEAKRVLSTLK